MRIKAKILNLMALATLITTGCNKGVNEHKIVEDFLQKNLVNNKISKISVSDADSTFYVNDSLIKVMRTKMADNQTIKKNVVYGNKDRNTPLYYVSATYKTHDGKKVKQTFYFNRKNKTVVCLKTDYTDYRQ